MGSLINNIGPIQIYRLINCAILLWPMQGYRSTAYLADTGPSQKYQQEFIGRPIQIYSIYVSFKMGPHGLLQCKQPNGTWALLIITFALCAVSGCSDQCKMHQTPLIYIPTLVIVQGAQSLTSDVLSPRFELLRTVTTKGGAFYIPTITRRECQKGESYKILAPWAHTQSPSGCMGIDQSEEWKPSNTTRNG